jgi:hypothetical protein
VIEPRVTKLGKAVMQQSTVTRQIESQIPISGIDQFGTIERFAPEAQQISKPLHYRLTAKPIRITKKSKRSRQVAND